MTTMQRFQAVAELTDGRIVGPTRIILADKIAAERATRVNGWDRERDSLRIDTWLAWSALRRANLVTFEFAELAAHVVDIVAEPVPDEPEPAGDDADDPSPWGHTREP